MYQYIRFKVYQFEVRIFLHLAGLLRHGQQQYKQNFLINKFYLQIKFFSLKDSQIRTSLKPLIKEKSLTSLYRSYLRLCLHNRNYKLYLLP